MDFLILKFPSPFLPWQTFSGAVYEPLLDELFCVSKGSGSWLNDRIVTVTKTRRLIEGAYRYIHDK